jgi:fatty-acyl-CoA synthase
MRRMSVFPQPLLDVLDADPNRPVFEHGTRVVRAGELLATISRMAGALRAAGLRRGSGVALITAITPEAYAAYLAAHTVGCRVVGVRPGYAPRQLAHVLGAGVDAIVVDETAGALPAPHPPVLCMTDLAVGPYTGTPHADGRPDDIARLVYTSGSTGAPMGCAWSYRAMSAHWSWTPSRWDAETKELAQYGERYLMFGTLASVVVQDYGALCLLGGGTAVIPTSLVGPVFPYAIERYRITGTIMTVPRLYQLLDSMRMDRVDTASLRGMLVAGSPLPAHRLAEAIGRLGQVMYQAYGQSETGNLTLLTPAHLTEYGERTLASVGRPHPGVEVDVRSGELYVRTPYQMSEYWRDPAQTADVLVDGWVRTRDLGYLDEHGFLHLTGRAREVIIVDASPYYAGPIELALGRHPDVDQAYVVGAPDEQTGEAVHAFVVPVNGSNPDRAELRELVGATLGTGSIPKTITYLAEVPVAGSGKPDKTALRSVVT